MALQVIVGAGAVGSAVARLLSARGDEVLLVSRRGTGPTGGELAGVRAVAADAADADRLTALSSGAAAIYNCVNPPYHLWAAQWPPIADALLRAAEASGAVLAITGNLYGYGAVTGAMTEDTELRPNSVKGQVRAQMWLDASAAHRAGRVRATEVRGSDYVGAGATTMFAQMVLPKVLAGRPALVPADLDAPHTVTYIGDVARLLVTVAEDSRAWGRPWHVPSNPALSMAELAAQAAALGGAPAPRLRRMPYPMLWLAGLADRQAREFREVSYQFSEPFVLDSSAATATFGISPTPLTEALRENVPERH